MRTQTIMMVNQFQIKNLLQIESLIQKLELLDSWQKLLRRRSRSELKRKADDDPEKID